MRLLIEDYEEIDDISNLVFDVTYGSKSVDELDIASREEIDHYFKLVKNVHEAEVFNYHSDYWGDAEEYQEQNVELIDALSPYINKIVTIGYDDDFIQGKFLGIAIDRQYNDISHTKVVLDNITELDEALELKETYERNIEKDLQTYCDLLMRDLKSNYPNSSDTTFTFTKGGKYYKILQDQSYGQSVHAFVDEDGNVYKPAGWRAPAKGVRARLEDIVDGKRKVDFAGGYLYKDRYVQ